MEGYASRGTRGARTPCDGGRDDKGGEGWADREAQRNRRVVDLPVASASEGCLAVTGLIVKTPAGRKLGRKKALFARHFDSQESGEWFRSLPCALTGLEGESHNAHTKSRGSGGSYKDIVPLSFLAHRDYDELGRVSFAIKYGTTKERVRERAADYQQLWEEESD